MKIQALQVPPIGTNCYLLLDEETGKGAIIDPGGAGAAIADAAEEMGMTPVAIFLTHGHYDHTGAVKELREKYPHVSVYLHAADAAMTKRVDSLMPDVGETVAYNEGDEIAVLYSEKQSGFAAAAEKLLAATEICTQVPKKQPLILDIVE